jgi:hypothetical protein
MDNAVLAVDGGRNMVSLHLLPFALKVGNFEPTRQKMSIGFRQKPAMGDRSKGKGCKGCIYKESRCRRETVSTLYILCMDMVNITSCWITDIRKVSLKSLHYISDDSVRNGIA